MDQALVPVLLDRQRIISPLLLVSYCQVKLVFVPYRTGPNASLAAIAVCGAAFFGCGGNKATSSKAAPLAAKSAIPTSTLVYETPPKPQPPTGYALAAGTAIEVELSDVIDSDNSGGGSFAHVTVVEDVKDSAGKIVIPAWSNGVITILNTGKTGGQSYLALALYQLTIGDVSQTLNLGPKMRATLEFREDASQGVGHRSVHLEKRTRLKFKLSDPIEFAKPKAG